LGIGDVVDDLAVLQSFGEQLRTNASSHSFAAAFCGVVNCGT
jgi:hypothetical protein